MCSKACLEVHSCHVVFSPFFVLFLWVFDLIPSNPHNTLLFSLFCSPACLLTRHSLVWLCFRCLRSRPSWTHFLSGLYWLPPSSPIFLLLLKTGEDTAWRRGCLSPGSRVNALLLLLTRSNGICRFMDSSSSTNASTYTPHSTLLLCF